MALGCSLDGLKVKTGLKNMLRTFTDLAPLIAMAPMEIRPPQLELKRTKFRSHRVALGRIKFRSLRVALERMKFREAFSSSKRWH